jgi:glutaredoxin 3
MSDPRTDIVVYRTSGCPFCVAAEHLLKQKNAVFEEVYLDDHPDRFRFVAEIKPGHYTVPLVVIRGEPIGGYQELMQLDATGRLDELLA